MKEPSSPIVARGSTRGSLSSLAELTTLDLSDLPLYGRTKELQQLEDVYAKLNESDDNALQAVFVHGTSGTGKSTLIDKFCEGLLKEKTVGEKKKAWYVSGKYDQFGVGKPYSALAAAWNDLCDQILFDSNVSKEEIKKKICDAVGSESKILIDVIPRLGLVIGQPPASDGGDGVAGNAEAFNRLAYVFRAFIRALCDVIQPLILFIDDLQWADESSLKLIRSMLTDSKSKDLLFIGSYRDNEVHDDHILSQTLKDIQEQNSVCKIKVQDFNLDTVNEMLADLTKLNLNTTMPLAGLVFRRTNGNVFFVLQFLDLLLEENLLVYSLVTLKWTWDMNGIKEKTNLSDNVVELVAGKLQRLDNNVQFVLKIAACLWSTFDIKFLQPVLQQLHDESEKFRNEENVVRILELAVKEGLVEIGSESRYRFSHDRIQQAAYSLISEGNERDLLHIRIGEIMLKLSEDYEGSKEWTMFIAAHQMNRGAACITDPAKQVELAELNLEVGRKAMSLSAFVPAAKYLESGVAALSTLENPWKDHYGLSLDLHIKTAEMAFCNGNVEHGRNIVNVVLSNVHNQRDKLPAYLVLIDSLVHKERMYEEALNIGFEVLCHLGEKVPRNPSMFRLIFDLVKTKRMLKQLSDKDFEELPIMENEDKIDAIRLLNLLVMCTFWSGKPRLFAIFIIRMMRVTLAYGVTRFSSYAFINYAVLLCSLGDFKAAHRLGKVAQDIVDRLKAKECKGRVLVLMNSFISPWQNPLYHSLEPLLQAHRIGMECGDTETGANSCGLYAQAYLFCGLPLGPLEKDYGSYCQLMREYKQTTTLEGNLTTWQFVLNLMGECDDPLVLTGKAMNQETFIQDVAVAGNNPAMQMLWLHRLQLAYYFGEMDLALEMAVKFGNNCKNLHCHFVYYVFIFFEALVYLEMTRRTKKRMYKSLASKNMKKMKKWVTSGVVDALHKLQLLEAEYRALTGKAEAVKEDYDLAIKTARRAGFLQDNALANERAGVFFFNHGDKYWASVYLSDAHRLYCELGAQGKADYLSEQYTDVFSPANQGFSSNLRGRSRFTNRFSIMHKRLSVEEIERRSSKDWIPQAVRSSSSFERSGRSSGSLRGSKRGSSGNFKGFNRSSMVLGGSRRRSMRMAAFRRRSQSWQKSHTSLGGRRSSQDLVIPQDIPSSESLQASSTNFRKTD